MITKHSSYSPPQRLPVSPAKPWSDKLRIGGSDDQGRCSSLKQGRAYKNHESFDVVKLTDTGERDER
jgi:hypothetical protein